MSGTPDGARVVADLKAASAIASAVSVEADVCGSCQTRQMQTRHTLLYMEFISALFTHWVCPNKTLVGIPKSAQELA